MPAEADLPRYEAFVVQPDRSTHWVVAIISDTARTKARRFARLADATRAARLADALNSRLLDRPNHQARLRAALDGLPLAVHAAVRHVPTRDPDNADVLAEHLSSDPIDGLMLFSDSPTTMTPRTAYALAFAAEDIGDLCNEAVQATNAQTARRFLPRLPVLIRRQRPEQLLDVAANLDQLAANLRDGILPETRTPADHLAVRLAVDHAERLLTDDPNLVTEGSQLLPTSPHDYDFDGLWRHLLDDTETRRMRLRAT